MCLCCDDTIVAGLPTNYPFVSVFILSSVQDRFVRIESVGDRIAHSKIITVVTKMMVLVMAITSLVNVVDVQKG